MKFDLSLLIDLAEKLDYKPECEMRKNNLVDYLTSDRVIAIAEAFRALAQSATEEARRADQNAAYLEALTDRMLEAERRAEAAEAECSRLDRESQNLSNQLGECDRKRRSALSKMAELEQCAEAAEAYAKSLNDIIDTRENDLRTQAVDIECALQLIKRLERQVLEYQAKLAELESKYADR